MNMTQAGALAAIGFAALTGCTTVRTLSVAREDGSTQAIGEVNRERKLFLLSAERNTAAVCLLTPVFSIDLDDLAPPEFLVVVRNGGDQTIRLSRDGVTATVDGRPVQVLTLEAYLAAIHEQERWESARARWEEEGPVFREAAPFPQEVQIYSPWEGGGRSYVPPPDRLPAPRPIAAGRVGNTPGKALLATRSLPVLGEPSIAPGKSVHGVVRLKPSELARGRRLRIRVRVGDETHEFAYDVGR